MHILNMLFISVMANVITYYICKWLDRNFKDNYPKEKTRAATLVFSILTHPCHLIRFNSNIILPHHIKSYKKNLLLTRVLTQHLYKLCQYAV